MESLLGRGWEALRSQKRGLKKRSRKLAVEQDEEVQRLIGTRPPTPVPKLPSSLRSGDQSAAIGGVVRPSS